MRKYIQISLDQASFNRIRHSLLSCFNDELHFMDMFPLVQMVVPIGSHWQQRATLGTKVRQSESPRNSGQWPNPVDSKPQKDQAKIVTNFLAVQDGWNYSCWNNSQMSLWLVNCHDLSSWWFQPMNEKYYCSQTGSFSQDFRVKFQKMI